MQALEKYAPFRSAGDDFADSNPIFAYYFYKFYLDKANDIVNSVQDAYEKSQIESQMKSVMEDMNKMQNKSVIKMSQQQNMTDIL